MQFLSFALAAVLLWSCAAQDPVYPYPVTDAYLPTTSILNHSSYVESLQDSNWLLNNIPFVDFPDKSVQDVYYYRTSVIKRYRPTAPVSFSSLQVLDT